jgi:hypothetical protein
MSKVITSFPERNFTRAKIFILAVTLPIVLTLYYYQTVSQRQKRINSLMHAKCGVMRYSDILHSVKTDIA